MAVLPFRVTSTDTLLGEGFAELLATEFTGDGVPRAIDMGTVLQAWRRAGGGTRRAVTRVQAMEIARAVGAGLVVDGSIVGLGQRITITASLIEVPNGASRGASARVTASPDSLDRANQRVASQLLGTATSASIRATEPEAMRAYLRGLREWRRGNLARAAKEFDAAVEIDSSFAPALYRRYLAGQWGIFSSITDSMLWSQRERLSTQDRATVIAMFGARFPEGRHAGQRLRDFEELVARYPDSPEALYNLGDEWLHFGAVISRGQHIQKARELFERAAAIDSQATVLSHLFVIAQLQRDTSSMRRYANALRRNRFSGWWLGSWMAAAEAGDTRSLAVLRRTRPDSVPALNAGILGGLHLSLMPSSLVEEMFDLWEARSSEGADSRLLTLPLFYVSRGRNAAAERLWQVASGRALEVADIIRLGLVLTDTPESVDLQRTLKRVASANRESPFARVSTCLALLLRLRDGDSTANLDRCATDSPFVTWTAELLRYSRSGEAPSVAFLERADSSLKAAMATLQLTGGHEPYLLAKAWERVGRYDRAYNALHTYRFVAYNLDPVWTLDYEARLAAMAGDTSRAISALTEYLDRMKEAEPVFATRVDSARAELGRLRPRR